jgi:hypothetical protein
VFCPNKGLIAQTDDYNKDGKSDVLWDTASSGVATSLMNGATTGSAPGIGNVRTDWQIRDSNAD